MKKIVRSLLSILIGLGAGILAFLWWEGFSTFPVTEDGTHQICKIPFFSTGNATKKFFGDSIELGTAKLTYVDQTTDGGETFILSSDGSFDSSKMGMGALVSQDKGRMAQPEAQRVFTYFVLHDLLSLSFQDTKNDAPNGWVKVEANGKERRLPIYQMRHCLPLDAARFKWAAIYTGSAKAISSSYRKDKYLR